jgi:hypothetical protein
MDDISAQRQRRNWLCYRTPIRQKWFPGYTEGLYQVTIFSIFPFTAASLQGKIVALALALALALMLVA